MFKYTTIEGAFHILNKGSLLLSHPSQFNDVFDVSIPSLFRQPLQIALPEMKQSQIDVIFAANLPTFNSSLESQKFAWIREQALKATDEQKLTFRTALLEDPLENVFNEEEMNISQAKILEEIREHFKHDGIFCASKRHDNLNLWGVYSDSHQGIVMELTPNLEEDSALGVVEPVIYSASRPCLYENGKEFIVFSFFGDWNEIMREFAKKCVFTKSLDWQHEEELRLWIPSFVPNGKNASLRLRPNELKAIYFGYKTPLDIQSTVIWLAQQINPLIQLYKMRPHPSLYELETIPIS